MEQLFKNNKEIRSYNAKRMREFRLSLKERLEVELTDIRLEETTHVNAKVRLDRDLEYYKTHGKFVDIPMIVRKTEDGYVLLAGWKYYHLAHLLGQDKVNVCAVDFPNRTEFMKSIGCVKPYIYCKMEKLNISAKLDCSFVSPEVLESIKVYDYKYHAPMMPIVVDKHMLIKDGYEQYLYNRNMEKEYCEIKIMK